MNPFQNSKNDCANDSVKIHKKSIGKLNQLLINKIGIFKTIVMNICMASVNSSQDNSPGSTNF